VFLYGFLQPALPPQRAHETFAQVKDTIDCEELRHVHVRGIAYPVATYRAIDLKANLVETSRAVRTELPHFRLELETELMSADERDLAAATLRDALDRLCHKPK
jgi:adenylate cyclase